MEKDLFGLHDTQRLLAEGFNPKFFTSIYTDEKGVQWPCVFEMGFNMGEKNTWVRDYPD
ncbi:hypothetical protein OQZ33_17105 [Pedobacter sp. MC2016-05]|uniref:hypothetical protein n=1 Tax=Pedobacter sp. MC2016-05 TaxID=2994474 RepID=UPI002245F966|nr:hypothetical protein [Pedobacter sp. MC2016-05]MCX2476055.1 hypothetical protein [Pedobacter sp. MC2016-05]